MSQASHGLMIKYGLHSLPVDAEVAKWLHVVKQYIENGQSLEEAGHTAAQLLFHDYRALRYTTESEPMEALLRAAENN